jgi:hypothetical protein
MVFWPREPAVASRGRGDIVAPTRGLPSSEALFRDFCFGHVEGDGVAFWVAELEGFGGKEKMDN